jgi:hypothetical protein
LEGSVRFGGVLVLYGVWSPIISYYRLYIGHIKADILSTIVNPLRGFVCTVNPGYKGSGYRVSWLERFEPESRFFLGGFFIYLRVTWL